MDDLSRRGAVKLTMAGAAALLGAGSAAAQGQSKGAGGRESAADAPSQRESRRPGRRHTYSGSSIKGNFEDALKDAINKARAAAPGADRQVRWTLKEVSGVNGGISPLNTLTVEIEAAVS